MFTGWFEKSLGHIVAPDENIPRKESNQVSLFDKILLAVAPDPVYEEKIQKAEEDDPVDIEAPSRKSEDALSKTTTTIKSSPPPPVPAPQRGPPPAEAFLSPVATLKTETEQVQCKHCRKYTPVRSSTADPQFQTPKTPSPEPRPDDDELEQKVISAAKVTAQCERTPPPEHSTIFRFCSSSKPLEGKLVNKLKKVCVKHPKLLKSRSVQAMGESAPKGYTPFLTAVYQSNLEAAKIILEQNPEAHLDVNLAGQSALHIAAQEGHNEMIKFLLGIDNRPHHSIVDLNGITALGEALTSPKAKARKNRSHLQQALFSPEDLSIRGTPLPASNRERVHRAIDLAYGEAELPGFRVIMEDAKVLRSWQNENGQFFCFLGVCDGESKPPVVVLYFVLL
jgi:hypothetical protein